MDTRIGLFVVIVCLSTLTSDAVDQGELCVACTLLASLAFEHPVRFNDISSSSYDVRNLCSSVSNSNKTFERICLDEAKKKINLNPDKFCATIGLCQNPSCKLFDKTPFPPSPLPPNPPNDPSNRDFFSKNGTVKHTPWMLKNRILSPMKDKSFYHILSKIIERLLISDDKLLDLIVDDLEISTKILPSHPCYENDDVLKCIIDRFTDVHFPIYDKDGDAFSPKMHRGLRGSHWRGADCNDSDANIYPGRKQNSYEDNQSIDHDCNGIHGIDTATGIPWEETLCNGIPRRGLIHLGDSATAHFHIPPQWMTKDGWNLENLIPNALDELDQPACAWGTAYKNGAACPYANRTKTSLGSIASRLRERNLCNHRDFQNIGVNGASSGNAMRHLIPSVQRDQDLDHPTLVIFSLIGNDVCSRHDGISSMTTPEDFYDNILEELQAREFVFDFCIILNPSEYCHLLMLIRLFKIMA